MALPQLKLVQDTAPGFDFNTSDSARRVFEHWLFMLGRSPRRCKMGPTRRQAIQAALAMGYEVDVLLLAIEGMAADPLEGARDDRMRDAMREIEWLLGREARIERWAEMGERLRCEAAAPAAMRDEPPTMEQQADDAAARERLRQRAAAMRGVAHG